jgi:hypothetical protein
LVAVLAGCIAGELQIDDLAARWRGLCGTGGCLTGGQEWQAGGPPEGCVLREPGWRELLGSPRDEVVPFLLDRIDSTEPTGVHVCPFQNAHEGELAVYALQRVLQVNLPESRRQADLRRLLSSPAGRGWVRAFFAEQHRAAST